MLFEGVAVRFLPCPKQLVFRSEQWRRRQFRNSELFLRFRSWVLTDWLDLLPLHRLLVPSSIREKKKALLSRGLKLLVDQSLLVEMGEGG